MITIILNEEKKILSEKWVTNIVAAFGSAEETFIVSPSEDKEISRRLWDLASVTKLYSLFTVLSLHEKGLFDITKKVRDYSNSFPNIADLHIYELLNFSIELTTSSRIDKCQSSNEAVDLLHNIQIKDRRTIYSDMGIIVVTQIINEYSDLFFRNYTYEMLKSVGIQNTLWWNDINPNETNIENYDSEYRYINGNLIEINTPIGTCHDPKARVIPYASGHAGLFANSIEVAKFAKAVICGNIISKDTLSLLLSDRYDSWDQTHHYGLLVNKKHPDITYSEIPLECSSNSIAVSGYSGTYLLFDFEKRIFVFIAGNRIFNRVTNINHDDTSFAYPCTKDYVFRKDILVNSIVHELIHE